MDTGSWKRPLAYGFAIAVSLRIVLSCLHAILWTLLSAPALREMLVQSESAPEIPSLTTDLGAILLGSWRRWDAFHYLNLAYNGYRMSDPKPTVFGPGAPLLFGAADQLIPGPPDLAAALVQIPLMALMLAIVWQMCVAYYRDKGLAPYAMVVCAFLPMGFIFLAPMSETLFLVLTLGFFYACARGHYLTGALLGFLASLTRSQGVILLFVAAALLYEQRDHSLPWRQQLWMAIRRGWVIVLIPMGYLVFVIYRAGLGLPPLNDVYMSGSYVFFVDPLSGILLNIRWILENPSSLVTNLDIIAMVAYAVLIVLMVRSRRHRRPALLTYTFATLLVIFSKMNYVYGTDTLYYSQSFARYALVLWPVHIFVAGGIRSFKPRQQKIALVGLASLTLCVAAGSFILLVPP